MPSSTSNFSSGAQSSAAATAPAAEPVGKPWKLWSLIVLTSAACILVGCELVTRYGFAHISRIQQRINAEYAEIQALRGSASHAGRPTVLLLGTSLLLEGVDYPRIRQDLASRLEIHRFTVEQTQYLDWYYGMRRLLAEGIRPSVMAVCLSPEHLVSNGLRGDYSAYFLLQTRDLNAAARDLNMDLTRTSGMYLAHYSMFYASRSEIRNFLIHLLLLGYGNLLHDLATKPGQFPAGERAAGIVTQRLAAFRELCRQNGCRFLLMIPPGFSSGAHTVVEVGRQTGVDVSMPVESGAFPRSFYRDGFHLNAAGAALYTSALEKDLLDRFAR